MEVSALEQVPLQYYFVLSIAMFCIGLFGILYKSNAIVIFMCIEILLNSVNLLLVALSVHKGDPQGQIFVFFIMAVAAAEVAIGLAILVSTYRNTLSVEIDSLNKLKG